MNKRFHILKVFLLLMIVFNVFTVPSVLGETDDSDYILENEWSWDPGAVNSFSGSIHLSDLSGDSFTLTLSSDLQNEDHSQINPVFTSVNGKRIKILNQTDTYPYQADHETSQIQFSGTLKLPEKTRVRKVSITVKLIDGAGKVLKQYTSEFSAGDHEEYNYSGAFYIHMNIHLLSLILLSAAVLFWTLAICLRLKGRKNYRRENHKDADL